jgi:hypothetical protein
MITSQWMDGWRRAVAVTRPRLMHRQLAYPADPAHRSRHDISPATTRRRPPSMRPPMPIHRCGRTLDHDPVGASAGRRPQSVSDRQRLHLANTAHISRTHCTLSRADRPPDWSSVQR